MRKICDKTQLNIHYFSDTPFLVKIYNTAINKSDFTLIIHTQDLDQSSTITVYGSQTTNQQSAIHLNANTKHFIGLFKKLSTDDDRSDSNDDIKKYIYKDSEPLPYVYLRVVNTDVTIKICEVIFN